MTQPLNVSFLGLGVMGGAIARHIGQAGHRLTIYNRSSARMEKWQEANPGLAPTYVISNAPESPDFIFAVTALRDG